MYKKCIAVSLLACASLSLMAQKTFQIKGNLKDTSRNGEKIVLRYFNGQKTVSTPAVIKDGSFMFEGTVVDPAWAKLTLSPTREMVKKDLWVKSEECEFF